MKEPSLYPKLTRILQEAFPSHHVIKVPGSTYNKGIPDFVLTDLVIEVKVERKGRGKARPTALQQHHLDEVSRRGGDGIALIYHEEDKKWQLITAGENLVNVSDEDLPGALDYIRKGVV